MYFSDQMMAARTKDNADLIDGYRNIIKASRQFIEYSLDINGPDPAGLGLETLNAIDKLFK